MAECTRAEAIALVSLLGIVRRAEPQRAGNLRAPVAVLLVIGVLGAWLTVVFRLSRARERNPVDLHAGLPVLTVGALLSAWLVVSEAGRELWAPGPSSPRVAAGLSRR